MGWVPSSDPRGVRLPTAILWFYPIPFLFVVSICLGLVHFIPSVSCPLSLSPMSSPLLFLCIVCSRFRLPLLFMFMYCVSVFCIVFLLNFRFAFLPSVSCPARCLSFRFPLCRCISFRSFCLCSAGSLLSCFSVGTFFCPSSDFSVLSPVGVLFSTVLCFLLVIFSRFEVGQGWISDSVTSSGELYM